MLIHGYCQRCHKIKRVRVMRLVPGKVQVGVCADCDAKARERG